MGVGLPLRKDSISSLTHAPWFQVMEKNGVALGPSAGAQWFQLLAFQDLPLYHVFRKV